MRHYTPRRPWAPLSDAEWAVLAPFIQRADGATGRPLCDARHRLDGMLHNACSDDPWRALPAAYGKPDTVSRCLRRWARAGLMERLLEAVTARDAPAVLRAMEYWLFRLARRVMRILKMAGLRLAQRLGLLTALPMVSWMLPNEPLSKILHVMVDIVLARLHIHHPPRGLLGRLGRCIGIAGGRTVWSRRFATG